MKHRDCKWILLILCTLFFCSACSVSDLSLLFMSKSDREIYVHDNPRFWDQTMPVPDSSNLFTLENDFFSGKPYNDLFRFGDNLLLAGEASYSSVIADHFNDGADDPYQYSFEVYSPWYNRIIATLPHTEVSCTSYQVCGDTLLLLDSESGQLLVYDSGLEPAGSYDLSFYEDIDALTFYASGISGTYYVYSPDSEAMECLRLSEAHTSHTPLSIPYYELVPLYSTPDEHTLTFSGVDASSLLDVIVVYDTEAGAVACTYPADSLDEVAADANTDFSRMGISCDGTLRSMKLPLTIWQLSTIMIQTGMEFPPAPMTVGITVPPKMFTISAATWAFSMSSSSAFCWLIIPTASRSFWCGI